MQPTRRFVALALVPTLLLLAACTSGDGDGGSGQETGPAPAQSFTPGIGEFTYQSRGLTVTVALEHSAGTIEVVNQGDRDLGAPGLYVLDRVDGHRVDADVAGSVPVARGESATFDVSLGSSDVDRIGLLVLLFGEDNYGAFIRTG